MPGSAQLFVFRGASVTLCHWPLAFGTKGAEAKRHSTRQSTSCITERHIFVSGWPQCPSGHDGMEPQLLAKNSKKHHEMYNGIHFARVTSKNVVSGNVSSDAEFFRYMMYMLYQSNMGPARPPWTTKLHRPRRFASSILSLRSASMPPTCSSLLLQ